MIVREVPYVQGVQGACFPQQSLVPATPMGSFADPSTGETVIYWGIGLALVGGLAWLIYRRTVMMEKIAEREGSSGVLKVAAGEAAIGLAANLFERNRTKKRKKRRGLRP